jgi:hypothetical protein
MTRLMLGALASLLLVLACAPSAAPSSPGAGGAASGPAPAGAALPDGAARQRVIDAARAEGAVNATIHTSWSPEGIQLLEAAIEREFGVRIQVNYTPVGNYPQRASSLFSEVAANATPSFDLYQSSDATSATLRHADAVEAVDWAPLLPAGTPPGLVVGNGEHIAVYTDHTGLMSDPTTIADADVPRSLKDLSQPRWRGKVMLFSSATTYLPWVLRLGREETLAALRAAVQNGSVVDIWPNHLTRFAAKEYPLSFIGVTFHHVAQARGIPSRFSPLDFSMNTEHHVSVARKAAHPNAARLLAAVLAGPEGQSISAEHIGVGNLHYANTRESQLEDEARAAGFPSFSWRDNPDGLTFMLSPEGAELIREIDLVLKGG